MRCWHCYLSEQQQQQQPFYGPLSGTTRVSRYQKKHSPTHHPDHHPVFISFFHLPWSIASSLFKLCAWQSFCTTSLHVICLKRGANDLYMLQLIHRIDSCLIRIQLGLALWCQLTQIVLKKRPLNGCLSCVTSPTVARVVMQEKSVSSSVVLQQLY